MVWVTVSFSSSLFLVLRSLIANKGILIKYDITVTGREIYNRQFRKV